MWRKRSFGSQSERGERFAEPMMTRRVRETAKSARHGSSGGAPTASRSRQCLHEWQTALQACQASTLEREASRVVGHFLAQAATLEAASVYAFQQLAHE